MCVIRVYVVFLIERNNTKRPPLLRHFETIRDKKRRTIRNCTRFSRTVISYQVVGILRKCNVKLCVFLYIIRLFNLRFNLIYVYYTAYLFIVIDFTTLNIQYRTPHLARSMAVAQARDENFLY